MRALRFRHPINEGEDVSNFRPLPFDYWRCEPLGRAADKCLRCARWAHHEKQTFGPRTPVMEPAPDGPECHWVAAYEEDEA